MKNLVAPLTTKYRASSEKAWLPSSELSINELFVPSTEHFFYNILILACQTMLLLSLLLLLFILFLELSIVISGEGVERKVVGNKTIKTDYERFVEQHKLFQVFNIAGRYRVM